MKTFKILFIFNLFISNLISNETSELIINFKEFSDNIIKPETGIDAFKILEELSSLSNEDPYEVKLKFKKIFENNVSEKNFERFLTFIPEIINSSINKNQNNPNEDDSLFFQHPYAAISIDKNNFSSLNVVGDVHSSYDSLGLIYKFMLNAKENDNLIFVGDYIDRDAHEEPYSSIFCLILTGALNAFYVWNNCKNNNSNLPKIIFNRGNHESIDYIGAKCFQMINNLTKMKSSEALLKKYFKNTYFLETLINIKNEATFIIGHSAMLEVLEKPIDCSSIEKTSFFYVNLIENNNYKFLNKSSNISNLINVQNEFYENFNSNKDWNTPIRFLGDPSNKNKLNSHRRIDVKIEDTKKIYNLNYKNSAPLNFIFFGHSHKNNFESLSKLCNLNMFCAISEKFKNYDEKFYNIDFLNSENKIAIFENKTTLKTLSNSNVFGFFLPPLYKNTFGLDLSTKTNNKIDSFIYRIKYNSNNELFAESIKTEDAF